MRIIDKKGRIFRKINILDILIIAFIVIFVIFIVKKVAPKKNAGDINNKTISYVVEVANVEDNVVQVIKKGDKLFDSSKGNYLGILKNFKVSEQKIITANKEKGIFEEKIVPNKKTLLLTIESKGYDTDKSIYAEGKEIKVGRKMFIKGKGYALTGFIFDIKIQK